MQKQLTQLCQPQEAPGLDGNQKDDKIMSLINQIQDTFTDDACRQLPMKGTGLGVDPADLSLMGNLMPQSTATLEQQLLQSTAPGLKLSTKDNNDSQLAQNL